MNNLKYVFGPVPSRRLGNSLGISPIPKKACNYSCIYCQLGRTNQMTNTRQEFFPLEDMIDEFKIYLKDQDKFDVVSIVGEGEPTLYLRLGDLIHRIKELTDKPIAVITNGALLYDEALQKELVNADIILPSLDAYDAESFQKIDRPHGSLSYEKICQGIISFSKSFPGQLWLEIMFLQGYNCTEKALKSYTDLISQIRHDRVYINTPVRPPAEENIQIPDSAFIQMAAERLNGISIDNLAQGGFFSEIENTYEAVLSIIGRHPMNQFEIRSFLQSRDTDKIDEFMNTLKTDNQVTVVNYKGYETYRLK